ncbi:hypothetical protein [Alteromonas sp. KUL49]|uniref:hypothetical protein n=1 Tax=Alteromonas sp. KUL49 TaxID=2480798 RepID=UPI00102F08B5|nr:hypothetical protein [Alteromonas sp. KUL49]TAP33078.1 hypothetical protein EYS00_20320 [Alteromonas sp. KUL49]GEA13749.1 hypothetical protein KUL49_41240 [Alteromonas sp. KUL49]
MLIKNELNSSDVKFFENAAQLVPIRKQDIYKRLDLSEPTDQDDVVFLGNTDSKSAEPAGNFSKANNEWDHIDEAVQDLVKQVKQEIDSATSLEDALDKLVNNYKSFDEEALRDLVKQELEAQYGLGMMSEG